MLPSGRIHMMPVMWGQLPIKRSMVALLQLLVVEISQRTALCLTYLVKNSPGVPAKVNLIRGQFIRMVHM